MDKAGFSSKKIYIHTIIALLLIVLFFVAESAFFAQKEVKGETRATMNAAKGQIEYRVQQSIQLLETLAAQEQYADPSIPYMNKVNSLQQMGEDMGYMMIRFVDTDINVCSQRGKTSLASRDYMQKLFTTGEKQVTDSFAAGADGVTLNYTIAVPLFYDGKISGCLFCAIYFDEVQDLLNGAARQDDIEVTLVGSKNQMMSATNTMHYGDNYLDYIRGAKIRGNTENKLEEDLLSNGKGNFWLFQGLHISFATYSYIENTEWSIIATMSFWQTFGEKLLESGLLFLICVLLTLLMAWILGRYLPAQKAKVQILLESVNELQRKLFINGKGEDRDLKEVLQLTREGLNDSLTGVVTRPVFLSQVDNYLENLSEDMITAVCFVDLDDLKKINDQYSHRAGDVVLKEVGFVLREYEKKFDGIVGRYGGDEFVLLLTGIKDMEELHQVLEELIERLELHLSEFGEEVFAHCSVGVSLWDKESSFKDLVNQADSALYTVKQKGKGSYKIYQGGEQ